ncbi:MAG: CheR family methyltransferase [Nitrospinota bacterium]
MPKESLSDLEFTRLADFIYKKAGIKMDVSKKILLEGRLLKRLRILKIRSYKEYIKFIFSREGEKEHVDFINCVTTNKTDFVREPWHFEFLLKKGIPKIIQERGAGMGKEFRVWSAGCSSGEEPYTLAMMLKDFSLTHSGFRFRILATDISTEVLKKASIGVYSEDVVAPLEERFKKSFLMKSKNPKNRTTRIVPELRALVQFRRLNFLDSDYGIKCKFEAIFCRNVFIYFDKDTQLRILNRFCSHMHYGSYLFLGHSETLNKSIDVPLEQIGPTIYIKTRD